MNWSGFTPHGFCLAWQPGLIWLEACSNILIAIAFFSIPAALITFLVKRRDLAFKPIFAMFAAFITTCGLTHVMSAVTLWVPAYWLEGILNAVTAAGSVVTAIILWPLLPRALALPAPAHLRAVNEALAREIAHRDTVASRLRESEERLRQAQKMEAVGQLTGGIAHDFNNELTAIMGCLELLQRDFGLEPRAARLSGHALQSAERAARLTSQLLGFSRRQRLDPVAMQPAVIVDGIHELLARTLGDGIALLVNLPEPGQWPLLADRNQVESALLNLVINARDAIQASAAGRAGVTFSRHVQIGFGNRVLDRARAETMSPDPLQPGDYVVLSVQDNGPGMPPAVLEKAFEPFFTTKPTGTGTGLGLSQTYGFATQSGGTVQLHSIEGTGTRVEVWLPRSLVAREDWAMAPTAPAQATLFA